MESLRHTTAERGRCQRHAGSSNSFVGVSDADRDRCDPEHRQVVGRIVEKLRPGGYLIVGHSESLNGINETVKVVKPTIYRLPS